MEFGKGHLASRTPLITNYLSAGVSTNVSYTYDGTTLTCYRVTCNLYSNATHQGTLKQYTIPQASFDTWTSGQTHYVVIDYNNGSPIYRVTTNVLEINESNVVPYLTIAVDITGELHIFGWDELGSGLTNKIHQRLVKTNRFSIESGLKVTSNADGYVYISGGTVWVGANPIDLGGFDSTVDTLHFVYWDGSQWQQADTTTFDYTTYNPSSGLEVLQNNKYNVNWVYRCACDSNIAIIVLSDQEYKSTEIATATPPYVPENVISNTLLVAKVAMLQGISEPSAIVNIVDQIYTGGSIVPQHNDLTNIQGGTVTERYHLDLDHFNVAMGSVLTEPTGFPNHTDSKMSFDPTTRIFTIEPTTDSYTIYSSGYSRTITIPLTITIPDVTGDCFIYFDEDFNLVCTNTFDMRLIYENIYTAHIYWNSAEGKAIGFGDERHRFMPATVHEYAHQAFGAQYVSGYNPFGFTEGNGSLDAHAQFGLSDGETRDEDIVHYSANTTQSLDPLACPILYKDGPTGTWNRTDTVSPAVATAGTGRLAYNNFDGSVWTLAEAPDKACVVYYYYATNGVYNKIVGFAGQGYYDNFRDAIDGISEELEGIVLTGLPSPEFVPLIAVVYETRTNYSNSVKSLILDLGTDEYFVDLRQNVITGASSAPTVDHGSLGGLLDPDHPATAVTADGSSWVNIPISASGTVQSTLTYIDSQLGTSGDTGTITDFENTLQ